MPDVFQIIDEIESDKQDMIATRLEDRAQMSQFAAIRENYFDRIGLPLSGRIHELGCGTGVVCRAIASLPDFTGSVVGSDLSARLVETARELTAKNNLQNISYYQADGHAGDSHEGKSDSGQYDLVLAHTVISHVTDPQAFLREAIRLVKPGRRAIIHDGDYASLTFDTGLPNLDRTMPGCYLKAIVANPYVMREIPRLLQGFELEITHAIGDVVLETGKDEDCEYFSGMARNYAPVVIGAGAAREAEVNDWVASVNRSLEAGTFFAYCNFVTYCVQLPG